MSVYSIDKLIADFDETISEQDTIHLLVRMAAETRVNEKTQILSAWEETVEWYTAQHIRIVSQWLDTPHLLESGQSSIVDFLEAFETLERDSLRRVMQHKFLAGLRREQLWEVGRLVRKRVGVEETLSAVRGAGVTVEVLSANWSQTFIEGAMEGLCDQVVTNRLVFDASGYSTGEIVLNVVSARDKWRHLCSRRSKGGRTAYIGDSMTDLLAILEADIGLLIGENRTALRAIERFQIPTVFANPSIGNSDTIVKVDSWKTLERLLERKA